MTEAIREKLYRALFWRFEKFAKEDCKRVEAESRNATMLVLDALTVEDHMTCLAHKLGMQNRAFAIFEIDAKLSRDRYLHLITSEAHALYGVKQ